MTKRQSLINKAAHSIAQHTDYFQKPEQADLEIKVIEITTDEDNDYTENATDTQWQRFSNEVLKKAEQLHWDRYHTLFD